MSVGRNHILLRILVCLLAILLPSLPALAQNSGGSSGPGHWQITYTLSGNTTCTWLDNQGNTIPPFPSNTDWSASNPWTPGQSIYFPGTCYNIADEGQFIQTIGSGNVHVTCKWLCADNVTPALNPPSQVYLLQNASAEWYAWGGNGQSILFGGTGTASNGTDPLYNFPDGSGGISQGVHMLQKDGSSGTVTLDIPLNATATLNMKTDSDAVTGQDAVVFTCSVQLTTPGVQGGGGNGSGGPDLAACVIWTKDFTVTPNTLIASFDGQVVAGPARVHIRFHIPHNYLEGSAIVNFVTVDEQAHHYPMVTLGSNIPFGNSWANPGCDCGDPTNDPNYIYCDVPWPTNQATTAGYHNGLHNIQVQVTYRTANSGASNPPGGGGSTPDAVKRHGKRTTTVGRTNGSQTVRPDGDTTGGGTTGGGTSGSTLSTISTELNSDVENVVIKDPDTDTIPNNPMPILWNPDPNSPATLTQLLSANFTAADKALRHAVLNIYDSANTSTPIAVLAQDFVCGGDNPMSTASFTWDGTKSDGTPANPGIYVFQWLVSSPTIPGDDRDSDKSAFLTISVPSATANLISDDGTTAIVNISYTLAETTGMQPSTGTISAYDSGLNAVFSQPLTGDQLSLGDHTVTVTMPSSAFGLDQFLIAVEDGDSSQDKDHSNRNALQNGPPVLDSYTVGFAHDSFHNGDENEPSDFTYYTMKPMGYHAIAWVAKNLGEWGYRGSDVTVQRMRATLEWLHPVTNTKRLKTVIFAGHGDKDGETLRMAGEWDDVPNVRLLVSTSAYHANSMHGVTVTIHGMSTFIPYTGVAGLDLDTVAPGGAGTLSNLDFVFLVGCYQGTSGAGLANEFLALGAQCILRLGADESHATAEGLFFDEFYKQLKMKTISISAAAKTAMANISTDLNQNPGLYGKDGVKYQILGPGANVILKP